MYRSVQFSISEQLLRRNVKRFRGGFVFKAHRLVYHSTLAWRVIKKKRRTCTTRPKRSAPRAQHLQQYASRCQRGAFYSPHDDFNSQQELCCPREIDRFGLSVRVGGQVMGGSVFKAHRILYHSTLGWRVIKKKKVMGGVPSASVVLDHQPRRACV